ncbi:hypothetical protein ACVWWN_003401 [Mycobacterium sp. URHB0021]
MKLDIVAMGFVPQPLPVIPQASSTLVGAVTPTAHLARMLPGFEPETAINAQDVALAECLNRPVHDILARLGGPLLPDVAPPAGPREQVAMIRHRLSLGKVSPAVIGEMDIYNSPGIDLRI